MNWLRSLWHRIFPPKPRPHTVFWCTVRKVPGPSIWIGDIECETGTVWLRTHSCTYQAHSVEQALAMHRSDHPGTRPTSVVTYN